MKAWATSTFEALPEEEERNEEDNVEETVGEAPGKPSGIRLPQNSGEEISRKKGKA